jgi:hypothetical protein
MSTQPPPAPDPILLALSRKLVLLLLLILTSAMGLVVLLLNTRISMPVLAFLLTDGIMGLVAGFSVRRIIPKKALVLRIFASLAFISGGLALLGWFTGWRFGIELYAAKAGWMIGWEIGQILLATGAALLVLFAWQAPANRSAAAPNRKTKTKLPHARRKPQKRTGRTSEPGPAPASPATGLAARPVSQAAAALPEKPKRKRTGASRPKLVLSGEEEHRCPYCLELIEPNDPRGVVECEICHTQHHADCWAITGACQVPHFTS